MQPVATDANSGGPGEPAPLPPAAEDVGIRAQFGRTETGEQCVSLVDFVGPGEATSPASVQAEQVFLRSLATMAPCTGPEAPPVIASSPAIEAARFWQDMDLPELAPQIQPGRALVGLTAYLETGGQPVAEDTGETPFGPLTITARRDVTVDWDDGPGSVSGPHTGVGAPYPGGDITWLYGRSGPRDVVVTQTWTAIWSIGDVGGTFSGRGTSSTIVAFPVEEVQAVRNR